MLAERALAQLRRSLGEGEQPECPRSLFSQKRAASSTVSTSCTRLFAAERKGTRRAVHETFARGAVVICPPLDEYGTNAGAKTVTLPAAQTFSAHALDETTPASHRERPITTLGSA